MGIIFITVNLREIKFKIWMIPFFKFFITEKFGLLVFQKYDVCIAFDMTYRYKQAKNVCEKKIFKTKFMIKIQLSYLNSAVANHRFYLRIY